MRNHYEYEVGHFERAIEVPSDTFRQQLPMAVEMLKDQRDKNIIMYCTANALFVSGHILFFYTFLTATSFVFSGAFFTLYEQ